MTPLHTTPAGRAVLLAIENAVTDNNCYSFTLSTAEMAWLVRTLSTTRPYFSDIRNRQPELQVAAGARALSPSSALSAAAANNKE